MYSKTIRISFLAKPAGNNAQIQFYMSAHKNTFGERSTKGVPYLIIF